MPKILHTGCGLEVDLAAPSACATGALGDTIAAYETGLNDGDLDNALLDVCAACAFSDRDAVFDATISGEANVVDGSLHNVQRDSFVPPQLDATAIAAGYAGYQPVETHPEPLEPIVVAEERTQQKDPPRIDRYVPGLMTGQAGIDAIMEEVAQDVIVPTKKAPKRLPFDELLTTLVPHYTAGGSVFGWSKIKTAKACLRAFYWQYVRQIVKKLDEEEDDPYLDASASKSKRAPRVNALELGTMLHLVIETIYRTGSVDEGWKICDLVKGSRPELALEARRLVHFYLRRFNAEEVKTWDLRAVEVESRYYFPARKLRGKRRSCCASSRHDHLYRSTKNGAKLPPGTVADSGEMRISELKSSSSLTANRLRAFYVDAQILLHLLSYNHGHFTTPTGEVLAPSTAEVFGTTDTVTVTVVGKRKVEDAQEDIARMNYAISEQRVLSFRDDLYDWLYEEVYDRLFSDAWLEPETWRKDWLCRDLYYPGYICPYASICMSHDNQWDQLYVQPKGNFERELLELPPKLAKLAAEKARVIEIEGK